MRIWTGVGVKVGLGVIVGVGVGVGTNVGLGVGVGVGFGVGKGVILASSSVGNVTSSSIIPLDPGVRLLNFKRFCS